MSCTFRMLVKTFYTCKVTKIFSCFFLFIILHLDFYLSKFYFSAWCKVDIQIYFSPYKDQLY